MTSCPCEVRPAVRQAFQRRDSNASILPVGPGPHAPPGQAARDRIPCGRDNFSEPFVFRPNFGKTVEKSSGIRGCFPKIPCPAEQRGNSASREGKFPVRPSAGIDRALFDPPREAAGGQVRKNQRAKNKHIKVDLLGLTGRLRRTVRRVCRGQRAAEPPRGSTPMAGLGRTWFKAAQAKRTVHYGGSFHPALSQ